MHCTFSSAIAFLLIPAIDIKIIKTKTSFLKVLDRHSNNGLSSCSSSIWLDLYHIIFCLNNFSSYFFFWFSLPSFAALTPIDGIEPSIWACWSQSWLRQSFFLCLQAGLISSVGQKLANLESWFQDIEFLILESFIKGLWGKDLVFLTDYLP